jgi:hypothetical protein
MGGPEPIIVRPYRSGRTVQVGDAKMRPPTAAHSQSYTSKSDKMYRRGSGCDWSGSSNPDQQNRRLYCLLCWGRRKSISMSCSVVTGAPFSKAGRYRQYLAASRAAGASSSGPPSSFTL